MLPSDKQKNKDTYLEQTIRKAKEDMERTLWQKFPQACYYDENNVLQIKDIEQLEADIETEERERQGEGRGGNNAAENIKKSLRATLKEKLQQRYTDFQERYFLRYNLKSQKENYFLIFLFLHQFVAQQRLAKNIIPQVIQINKRNIRKYITHSQTRLQERPEFHQKNIQELTKYLEFNVDFTAKRRWEELQMNITSLFLKKKANAIASIEKVEKIVQDHEYIKNLFVQFSTDQEENNMIDEAEPVLKIEEQNIDRTDFKNSD